MRHGWRAHATASRCVKVPFLFGTWTGSTSYVRSRNVTEQFTKFGASGAVVVGLLTWLLLAVLLRETEP